MLSVILFLCKIIFTLVSIFILLVTNLTKYLGIFAKYFQNRQSLTAIDAIVGKVGEILYLEKEDRRVQMIKSFKSIVSHFLISGKSSTTHRDVLA